ncbi:metallophosphoesterase [Actinocorallia lasiicapitis]
MAVVVGVLALVVGVLFGVSWWGVIGQAGWPGWVGAGGSVLIVGAAVALPGLMVLGHGRGNDRAAVAGDALLGAAWILFSWSVIGLVVRGVLAAVGVEVGGRVVAGAVLGVAAVLMGWGFYEAMRVPRVERVEVELPRLAAGLDGTKIVLLTDTHYGPIDRADWSRRVTEVVNGLDADVVAHTGDIADGSPVQRREQASHLADVKAGLARVYVTGNHEYLGDAGGWVAHMGELGWEALHNRHVVVERGGDRLVLAGVDDATARGSGLDGHGADIGAALHGADPALPVVLLAHQPKQVPLAEAAGVDLQLSGHTHAGQIWPFRYLVRLDQPVVAGLSRRNHRTQLYTSRGTGFWGPPFRVFAPSEITLITLRAPRR